MLPTLATLALSSAMILMPVVSAEALAAQKQTPQQMVVEVKGLACPFCVYGLQKHLRKLPNARTVRIDLGKSEATVDFEAESTATEEQIKKAVRDAGFTAGSITWKDLVNGTTEHERDNPR